MRKALSWQAHALPDSFSQWNMVFNIIRLLTNMETGTELSEVLERSAENKIISSPIRIARALTHASEISASLHSQVWVCWITLTRRVTFTIWHHGRKVPGGGMERQSSKEGSSW